MNRTYSWYIVCNGTCIQSTFALFYLVDKIKSAGSTPPEGMISAENSEEDEEYDEQLAQVNI